MYVREYNVFSPLLLIFQIYIVGEIFHVFKSGYPQPADFFMFLAIISAGIAFLMRPDAKLSNLVMAGILFAAYTFIINIINYAFNPDLEFLLSSLYYVFNTLSMFTIIFLANRDPETLQKKFYTALLISVGLQVIVGFLLFQGPSFRAIGTFNNPNQFSYWALLSFCILIALRYPARLTSVDLLVGGILTWFIIAGLSKAAMLAYALALLGILFSNMVSPAIRYITGFSILCLLSFVLFDLQSFTDKLWALERAEGIYERFTSAGEQADDTVEARGYLRLLENPEYVLLGAGEGAYHRFKTPYQMHSGLGTILFSYGIVGASLFAMMIFLIFKNLPRLFWVLLAAIMFYGLTHHNIRFTYFWVFLGACYLASLKALALRRLLLSNDKGTPFYSFSSSSSPPLSA